MSLSRIPPMSLARRRVVGGAAALVVVSVLPAPTLAGELPAIPAMAGWLAGRVPVQDRISLELPRLADNGFAVPMRIVVAGPFAPGPHVRSIRLFSEANPVPEMAVFEFPAPTARVEVDSRIRLATTQSIVAVAQMSDGGLFATAAEVVVTLAGCMDGT